MTKIGEWADPRPLGICALIIVCFLFGLLIEGRMLVHSYPLILVLGIAGSIAQFVTGLILFKRGGTGSGGIFTAFGLFFVGSPCAMVYMETQHIVTPHGLNSLLGPWNIILGLFILVWAITFINVGWVEFLVIPIGSVVLFCIGIFNLTGSVVCQYIGAYGLYVATIWGFWMLAHCLGEEVGIHIPVGRPLRTLPKK